MRRIACLLTGGAFALAGLLHFARPAPYMKIMPPYLPWHLPLVYVSGAAEMAGGLGLWARRTRRLAGWWLVTLLVAVFPANLYMATGHVQVTVGPMPAWVAWARLPLQAVLIWWVWWCAKPERADGAVR